MIWLRLWDGTSGEIELASALDGPITAPLGAVHLFKAFQTLVWPRGAGVAPEFLHDNIEIAT